jgi:hypothetical protein
MQKNGAGEIQHLDSGKKLTAQSDPATSENLLKNVSMQLYELMKKVVADEVTPKTVNAACGCASEIHKMLKLNREISRGV